MTVSSLTLYPVKSCAGISLEYSELDGMGLKHDRRWMLVSPEGLFLSQRKYPRMALIQPKFIENQLVLSCLGHPALYVSKAIATQTMTVGIWQDTVTAQRIGAAEDQWLSTVLKTPCHLVYIPDNEIRACDPVFSNKGDHTGFADGFPLLLISQASLDDLNSRLEETVEMRRFRPNIVVTGSDAFAEDTWKQFTVGNLPMRGVKPCSRCVITTVDPNKGERKGKEPLKTLMMFRKQGNAVYFGQNVIHEQTGRIQTGDPVVVQRFLSP